MGDMSAGPGGVLYNTPDGPSGLFAMLDPAYQAKQLALQNAQLELKRATAYQNGVPTNPDGSLDIDSMARTQIQNGDAAGGLGLMMSGLKLQMLRDPSTVSNPTGQGGGAPAGGSGILASLAPQRSAADGMIAPAAGGDDYGRAPGNGYSGVGQVGAGGIGAPAPAAPGRPAGGAGAPAANVNGLDPIDVYAHSIGSLESGNRYDALGQVQKDGAQAIGRYQVMSTNVGPWTKEVLGQAMSPEDFRNSPDAQDAVFRAKFGQSVSQYGNPFDAASIWFSGKPLNRAGNATDSLGTNVPTYIQRFAAGLNPAIAALRGGQGAGGQGSAPQAAPAGGQGALVSFGGPSTPSTATPAAGDAPAPAPATPAQPPVSDDMYATAKRVVRHFENADPSTMSLDEQRAVTMSTGLIDRYESQQRGSGAAAAAAPSAPVTDSQVMQARGVIRAMGNYDPTSLAPGARTALAAAQATVARYGQEQATPQASGPASAGTADGAPVASPDEAPKSGMHPFAPGGNALKSPPIAPTSVQGQQIAAGSQAFRPVAAPIAAAMPGGQGAGGVQPVSFGGPAPQAAPTAPAPGNIPPDAAAALQRLRSGQGSPADGQLWSGYLKSVGGSIPAGQAGGVPPRPAAPSGPDLPYLQGKYAVPGGGAQYVSDMLDTARRYGLAGEQQAAQAFIERAKQVQSDLQEVNKGRIDLANKNAELTPAQKDYQAAVAQGFQGSGLDYLNAVASGKATATAAGRNAQLTGGQKEFQAAVANGFQGSEADYQAAAASEKAEQEGQGRYLGGLPEKYAAAADAGRAANDNVDQMLTAAQGFTMGAGADTVQSSRKALQAGLRLFGVSDPRVDDPTASYEDLAKLTGAHLRNVVSAIAGPKGVQELQLVGSSLPSAEMSYDGFRGVSASLKGSNDFAIAKQQAAADWTADPAHKNSLSGFEANWNRNVTPSTFWLNRLRVDQPDLFAQAVQRLGQTNQGRGLLTKAKAGMGWATNQGLM